MTDPSPNICAAASSKVPTSASSAFHSGTYFSSTLDSSLATTPAVLSPALQPATLGLAFDDFRSIPLAPTLGLEYYSTMPTITETPSSSAPSSSATEQNNNNLNGSPPLTSSATLYLYTFLATLLLLLSVSAAIVLRSYVLRRRARAAIAEAIANGTYVPPPAVVAATQPKPVLSDVWIGSRGAEEEGDEKAKMKERERQMWAGAEWARMMPVSAALVAPESAPGSPAPSAPSPAPRRPWMERIHVPMGWYRALPPQPQTLTSPVELAPLGHPHPTHPEPAPTAPAPAPTSSPQPYTSGPAEPPAHPPTSPSPGPGRMRVAVLIAMPGAEAPEPGALPSVEFGLAEVPFGGTGASELLGGER
ncbi:hypothetical protein OBBRIDRAFT_835852 [Obba rivulosa]|uniref:Uncharacterized protein n=1 Tax=Obba rivulosa TaxID=1052685 RepID=A0A8E2DJH8_9APHY|nr:hypothetical protein OBBRIDRAFT_835852 [Obba rivulosa]